jgi:hypothetical protein
MRLLSNGHADGSVVRVCDLCAPSLSMNGSWMCSGRPYAHADLRHAGDARCPAVAARSVRSRCQQAMAVRGDAAP